MGRIEIISILNDPLVLSILEYQRGDMELEGNELYQKIDIDFLEDLNKMILI